MMCAAALWGLQLIIFGRISGLEPVSNALRELTPWWWFQPPVHGALLLTVTACHVRAMYLDVAGRRRHCVAAEMVFYIYAWWALMLSHTYVPYFMIAAVYITFSFLNFSALKQPAPAPLPPPLTEQQEQDGPWVRGN